jgi:uncharacterized protein YukE
VQVDPHVLRAFAGQVDGVANVITGANLGNAVLTAADGLPSSTTQWAAHAVGEHFTQLATKLADNVTKMGQAVRGAGDKFEVADDALASSFDGLFG